MRLAICAAAVGAVLTLGAHGALAFTYENHGAAAAPADKGAANVAPKSGYGYVDLDGSSMLPPIGESVKSFDFGPGSTNNGMASQPTRGGSVGPSWLYPPGR